MIPSNQIWWGSGSGGVSVLQDWYDSLAVKPSEGLWTDLKIMADGMSEDGDWDEMDLFGMPLGMETEEQSLKPFKTTSGLDFTKIGTITINQNGVTSNGTTGFLNLNYIPSVDKVKFAPNSSFLASYVLDAGINATNKYLIGVSNSDIGQSTMLRTTIGTSSFSLRGNLQTSDDNSLNISNSLKTGLKSVKYNNIDKLTINNSGTTANATGVSLYPEQDKSIYACCINLNNTASFFTVATLGAFIAGSSDCSHSNIENRINTYRIARGL